MRSPSTLVSSLTLISVLVLMARRNLVFRLLGARYRSDSNFPVPRSTCSSSLFIVNRGRPSPSAYGRFHQEACSLGCFRARPSHTVASSYSRNSGQARDGSEGGWGYFLPAWSNPVRNGAHIEDISLYSTREASSESNLDAGISS
ncbi:hypothetical protein BDZ89DRAFT_680555 [Hymenopellis radicata]|nr:hypothetical protein BDZ89DRAFT_680555 [Hymenopellis radicata]